MNTNKYKVTVNGLPYEVEIESMGATSQGSLNTRATTNNVVSTPVAQAVQKQAQQPTTTPSASGEDVLSPMQGKIVSVAVSAGQVVKKGDVLAVLEAMKMENEIMAAFDAKVVDVHVIAGQSVEANDRLVSFA